MSPTTDLIAATWDANADLVRGLLNGGASVNERDAGGRTALSYAAEAGMLNITSMLIDGGADANLADNNGRSPVFWWAQGTMVQPI